MVNFLKFYKMTQVETLRDFYSLNNNKKDIFDFIENHEKIIGKIENYIDRGYGETQFTFTLSVKAVGKGYFNENFNETQIIRKGKLRGCAVNIQHTSNDPNIDVTVELFPEDYISDAERIQYECVVM